jgi:hypothetical protein
VTAIRRAAGTGQISTHQFWWGIEIRIDFIDRSGSPAARPNSSPQTLASQRFPPQKVAVLPHFLNQKIQHFESHSVI